MQFGCVLPPLPLCLHRCGARAPYCQGGIGFRHLFVECRPCHRQEIVNDVFLIPNLATKRSKTTTLDQVGLSVGLIFVVHAMYQCLVNYTGAVPAEFYSIKKRPVGMIVNIIKYMMNMCTKSWSTALD